MKPLPASKPSSDLDYLISGSLNKDYFSFQLEDDIVAKPEYTQIIKNFAAQQESKEWMILEFSQLGFIGKCSNNIKITTDGNERMQNSLHSV